MYSGHGSTDKLDVSTVTEKVYHNEAEWGDYDLEWIGLDCCLAGTSDFSSSFNGAHLILGFSTTAYDSDLGSHWADYLVDSGANDIAYTVKNSWFYGADIDQPNGKIGKVMGETSSCGNDYIWGQGTVIADPSVDGSFTSWTYNM